MARPTNNERLRRLVIEYGLTAKAVADIVKDAGFDCAEITAKSWLARAGTKSHRNGPPDHKLKPVQDWCKKYGKRKKD